MCVPAKYELGTRGLHSHSWHILKTWLEFPWPQQSYEYICTISILIFSEICRNFWLVYYLFAFSFTYINVDFASWVRTDHTVRISLWSSHKLLCCNSLNEFVRSKNIWNPINDNINNASCLSHAQSSLLQVCTGTCIRAYYFTFSEPLPQLCKRWIHISQADQRQRIQCSLNLIYDSCY